jgi:hypothetical protein
VPTVGAWLRGSFGDLNLCADTAAHNKKVVSAAITALVASFIAFLLQTDIEVFVNATTDSIERTVCATLTAIG